MQEDLNEVLRIRREKLNTLRQQGKDPFAITVCETDTNSREIVERFDELEGQTVTMAGRIMSWRDMGKAAFIDLRDREGRMQVYLRIDDLGTEAYNELKLWDIVPRN